MFAPMDEAVQDPLQIETTQLYFSGHFDNIYSGIRCNNNLRLLLELLNPLTGPKGRSSSLKRPQLWIRLTGPWGRFSISQLGAPVKEVAVG